MSRDQVNCLVVANQCCIVPKAVENCSYFIVFKKSDDLQQARILIIFK